MYVAINSCSGDVYSAKCNCVSGLGQACNHVAALLFYLEHHSGKAELPVELSKTSKPMEWNRPSKKVVQPARANDIAFHKPAHGEAASADDVVVNPRSGFHPRAPEDRVLHEDALHELLESVQECFPESGLSQFGRDNPTQAQALAESSLRDLIIFYHDRANEVDFSQFFQPSRAQCREAMENACHLSHDVIKEVERMTRGQAANELWRLVHNGRLTSSRFGEILRRTEMTSSRRLVKEIMGYGGGMHGLTPAMR